MACLAIGNSEELREIHTVTIRNITTYPIFTIMNGNDINNNLNVINNSTSIDILFAQINSFINSQQTVSQADWKLVIQQLYEQPGQGLLSLTNVGSKMPFGNKKVMFYFTMLNYLHEKQGDKTAEAIKFLHGSTCWNSNLDELAGSNPVLSFLKFQNDINVEIHNIFRNVLVGNQLLSNPEFNQLHWNLLTEAHLRQPNAHVLPLQAMLNATALEYFSQIDLSNFIEQIEKISNDVESDKIKKLHLYGALLWATNKNLKNHQAVPDYFKLVISWRNFWKNNQFNVGNMFFNNYNKEMEESMHGCAKTILNAPPKNIFMIRNRSFNEYLYAQPRWFPAGKTAWVTTPNDLDKTTYWPAHLWIPGFKGRGYNSINYKWHIVNEGDRFWFVNAETSADLVDRYIDTSHQTNVHCPKSNNGRQKHLAIRLVPSYQDNESCFIQNYDRRNTIYAVDTKLIEDNDRRQIYSNGKYTYRGNLWCFPNFKF